MANKFPKRVRLLRACEFERVFASRASAADASMVLYAAPNQLGHPRLGLVVSRRIGGAVERNRWKRRLREAFRLTQNALPSFDLVCIPRLPCPSPLEDLKASFVKLTTRIEQRRSMPSNRSSEKAP